MDCLNEAAQAFRPDSKWIAETKDNYRKLFQGESFDFLPISFGSRPKDLLPHRFNLEEQFHDPYKMAYEQIRSMLPACQAKSALLPAKRANLGVGFIASIFGIEQRLFPDKMPWPQGHLSKEEIAALDPENFADEEEIAKAGLIPHAERIYEVYGQTLGTTSYCFIPDTQGIFDLAHLVRGQDLFLDLFDDPGFVHHLMEVCLQAYISVSKYMKKVIGEPLSSGMHGGIYMENGGVRYCMDTSVLLSAEQVEEFEVPYLRRALSEFGGGWIHFCGYAPHLIDVLVEIPEVRGINPNYMETRPYDYDRDMGVMQRRGKFLLGAPFKSAAESTYDYFRRVLHPLEEAKGLLFTPRGQGLDFSEPDSVKELWQKAQADTFAL